VAGSIDPYCTHVLNVSEIDQSAAELLRFKYVHFGHRSHRPEVDFNNSEPPGTHRAPACQISTVRQCAAELL